MNDTKQAAFDDLTTDIAIAIEKYVERCMVIGKCINCGDANVPVFQRAVCKQCFETHPEIAHYKHEVVQHTLHQVFANIKAKHADTEKAISSGK